ncbi:hypothetical protein [Rugosimonospora africana]|uniref:Uncharacterized protein n=1 Tax=Rugosimonospora africana TaxID=556532 RepID=A0A8J3QRC6_9ACTN|nr:hypothetical protein [Rugosimonospora africana]GIH15136.1 hypothetical protein Raf01_33080 [Rugosimonospora africana]
MIGPWDRVEGSSHDDELDSGVEARIADPLWMLARQWQVGELRGDDAGSPAVARLNWTSIPLRSYRPGGGPDEPMPTSSSLERMVEATAPPTYGAGALYWATRLAGQISRRLVRQGLDDAVDLLRGGFPLADDGTTVALRGAGTTAAALARGRGFDGAAVFSDSTRTTAALAPLPAERREQVDAVITRWRADVSARFGIPAADAWDEHRLEYQFSLTAATTPDASDPDVVLTADKYTGGHLDWYSFDIDPGRQRADQPTATPAAANDEADRSVAVLPTPVRYSGMPAPRWWAFEDGDVHFGDIAADPGDLGRLLLADYATGYGNDWFSVPLRLPIATLTRVTGVHVFDTMGRRVEVPCAALLDDRKPGRRAFRLYELTGDTSVADGQAPLLFVPPSLSGSEVGPALDRVEFVRDEAANLVWAVERLVEGPTGRSVDRLQQWRTSTPPESPPESPPGSPSGSPPARVSPVGRRGGAAAADAWRYRIEAAAPPYWIPFLPLRTGNGAQIRLRRARMQDWQLLDPAVVGARSELLRTDRPMSIDEEEVPRGGITVQRRWQAARWTDGSMQVWLQRSKRPGTGERSSGLRWDGLDDHLTS